MPPFSELLGRDVSNLSPIAIEALLKARNAPQNPDYTPGRGTVNPTSINNNAIFALFGLLGAGLVISSIWFFFWAKNGGFRWRKRDWDDYKSTVLRRKGPNGTTLSGATKSTKLGDGSVVGSLGSMEEYKDVEKGDLKRGGTQKKKAREKQVKNSQDADVRAYRHEKVAKVGGLNREADGSHHDSTNSDMSSHGARNQRSDPRAHRNSRRDFNHVPGTESNFSGASDDSRRPLRSSAQGRNVPQSSNHDSRPMRQVPRSTNNRYSSRMSNGGSYTDPLDFNTRHEGSVDGSEQARNTKAYFHPIPGLSKNMPGGFRRDGGRRDSLGDSDNETRYS